MYGTLPVNFESRWSQLSDVVSKIIRRHTYPRELWFSSFTDVYALANAQREGYDDALYSSTTSLINARVKEIAAELALVDDLDLLPVYVKYWSAFHEGLSELNSLYRAVNQCYVARQRPNETDVLFSVMHSKAETLVMPIMEVGLTHWKLYLIDIIKSRLTKCLMREVENDRAGISGQQSSIYPCIDSLIRVSSLRDLEKPGMDIYHEIFRNPLLQQTESFYSRWAVQHQTELSCSSYISQALTLRQEEEARADQYYKCSKENIFELFQQIVVKDRLQFLNQCVHHMVAEEHKTDLHNLYVLLEPNNLYTELSQWFGRHVAVRTREVLSALPSEPGAASKQFVENLLALRDQFMQFLKEVFDGSTAFCDQMNKAFKEAVNNRTSGVRASASVSTQSNTTRPSELLSRYIDTLLRKGVKSLTQSEIEAKIKSLITLFKYLDDKDMFQRFYQKMLFKRLIFSVPPAMDLEEFVISQLKAVCGYEFTNKFHRMFKDIQLGPEINRGFADYLTKLNVNYKFGHQFNVLTQCSWPISLSNNTEFNLPTELQQCISHFETFYATRCQGRKMRWVHQFSTVELALLYLNKPYQLHIPVMHAMILLQYDAIDSDRIPLRDLYQHVHLSSTGQSPGESTYQAVEAPMIPENAPPGQSNTMDTSTSDASGPVDVQDLIQRFLVPLLEINLIYLETDGQVGNTLDSVPLRPDTYIVLNPEFKNKRLKIRVTATNQTKESIQTEAHKVEQQVTEDRQCFLKAAIVRIMKSNRQMDHSSLLAEVVQQASNRFHASTTLIKQCIENLIDHGYLERNPQNANQYNYLA